MSSLSYLCSIPPIFSNLTVASSLPVFIRVMSLLIPSEWNLLSVSFLGKPSKGYVAVIVGPGLDSC